MIKRLALLMVVFLVLLFVGLHFLRKFILNNASVPNFTQSQTSATIRNALLTSGSPIKDFDIENNVAVTSGWNVVWLKALDGNVAVVVVKSSGSNSSVVLGPGSQFSSSSLSKLPVTVQYYLYSQGLVVSGAS